MFILDTKLQGGLIMKNKELFFEDEGFEYNKIIRDLVDIFNDVEFGIDGELVEDIFRKSFTEGTGLPGKAPILDFPFVFSGADTNYIPSIHKGSCKHRLIVQCFDRDNLEDRLVETIYHAGIHCRDKNRKVAFITTQWKWKSSKFRPHEKAIKVLNYNGVDFYFILISRKGASLIPV